MKNHYKIHAENYEDIDFEQDDTSPNTNQNQPATTTTTTAATTAGPPVFKTEMLDWLRSDFDEFDLGPTPTQLTSDRITRSMKKLSVGQNKEDDNQDWVHVE
jgi:hypothetical protein